MPSELRLLSLLSSATEIIHALGFGNKQIGRSHECDFPTSVHALPVCSWPNIPVDVSSRAIDASVRNRARDALSIYDLDAGLISQLQPTHIFTQTQCKVCAVSLEDVERTLRDSMRLEAHVVSLEPYWLEDVWNDIRRVALACRDAAAGERLIATLKERMAKISGRAQQSTERPRVATIEWLEPLMVAGNWIPELIELAGGSNLFGTPGGHSPYVNWTDIQAADPDVLVVFPCGFGLERTRTELACLTSQPGWAELRAVRKGRAYYCDGNQYMNRPGPRLVESLAIFAELLHPVLFVAEMEGTGWRRIEGATA